MSMIGVHDCWNEIGVRGDSSCPKLEQHVHCRNCPVYSAAALALFDRELSADQVGQATRQVARKELAAELDARSVVVFRLGAEWLGIPTIGFREIASERTIHSIPHRMGDTVLGVANVRGELLICVSLQRALGIERRVEPKAERALPKRLLVLKNDGHCLACPVDEVHGVEPFRGSEYQDAPATVAKAQTAYTKAVVAWQGKSVGVLDLELIFYKLNRGLG
jgi:chemotaxis-related protein WspD